MLIRVLFRLLPWLLLALLGWWLWKGFKNPFGNDQPEVQVTHNTILTKVEQLGKLELVRYHFKDIVEHKKEISTWLPDSRTVLIVAGEAVGCIDLRKVTAQDLINDKDTLYINLPAPELCYFKVDHNKSKVFHTENTYFQDATLVDEAYRYAEANVKRTALQSGILKETQQNADKILQPMLEQMTGKRVVLVHNERQKLKLPERQ